MNLEQFIPYYGSLGRMFGSKAGLLLSYFLTKQANPDGFIQLTQADIQRDTALTRREQESARAHLRDAGILEEQRVGLPARSQYRIDFPRLVQLIREYRHD